MPRDTAAQEQPATSSANVHGVRAHEIPYEPPRRSPTLGIIAAAWGVWSAIGGVFFGYHVLTNGQASAKELLAVVWLLLTAACLCVGGSAVANDGRMRWLVLMGVIAQAVPITLLLLR